MRLTNLVILNKKIRPVNKAYVIKEAENIVAIQVDLKIKYCEFHAISDDDGVPEIDILIPTSDDYYAVNDKIEKPTQFYSDAVSILFPEYKDWEVFSVNIVKYSMYLCLIKKELDI